MDGICDGRGGERKGRGEEGEGGEGREREGRGGRKGSHTVLPALNPLS